MNINAAYQLLEVSPEISDDELKTQYKKLAKQYHPDRYKEDPDKFKKINEAYQFIQNYRKNPMASNSSVGNPMEDMGLNLNDIFNSFFGNAPARAHTNILPPVVNLTISFADSVLGCKKEINYRRKIMCSHCQGEGKINSSGQNCATCNNTGKFTRRAGNMIISQPCPSCSGNLNFVSCPQCKSSGLQEEQLKKEVVLPPGLVNGKQARIQGGGHYSDDGMFGAHYGDLLINIKVSKDSENRYLEGHHVISELTINLLSALEGDTFNINTLYGEKSLLVPKLTKHGDFLEIPGCGVKNTNGAHKVKINITYPEKIDNLIQFLKHEG